MKRILAVLALAALPAAAQWDQTKDYWQLTNTAPTGGSALSGLTTAGVPYATSSSQVGTKSTFTFDSATDILSVPNVSAVTVTFSAPGSATPDLGLSRAAPGVLSVDGATAGDALGTVKAANIYSDPILTNLAYGPSALNRNTTGSYNTATGYYSLFANTIGNFNTANGDYALFANTTGNYNTAIGYSAGRYEVGSSSFYVDNQDRADTAGDQTKALLYGKFNADAASQMLTCNAGTVRLPYLPVYADNTAALAGGLVAGSVYRTSTGVLMIAY